MKPVQVIEVRMWGNRVGAVAADPGLGCYAFAYEPAWKRRNIELAPLTMPLADRRVTFAFPSLPKATYLDLPAMLADALPDDFDLEKTDSLGLHIVQSLAKQIHGNFSLHAHSPKGTSAELVFPQCGAI